MLGRSRFRSRSRYLTGGAFPNAALYLNLLSGSLDSRVTFSRGSNATLVDGTGRIVYAPANLAWPSEQFDNAVWSKLFTSVTANTATAPDNTATADTLTASAGLAEHLLTSAAGMGVSILAGVTYAISMYVKAGASSFIQIYAPMATFGTDAFANFNVATGTVGTVGSAATASIQNVGNGWYRCSMVATAIAAGTRINFGVISSATAVRAESWTATGTETLFIWGAQLEQVTYQTVPGPYVATTSAAYYGPRFDYNPVTLAPLGLLIEEARMNLALYSAQFDNAAWIKSDATITANATASPDGTANADKLVETATTADHYIDQVCSFTTGTTYTFSFYAKAGERNIVSVRSSSAWAADPRIRFTLAGAGTVTVDNGSPTGTITAVGNGWYRCTMTATTNATNTGVFRLSLYNGAYSYAGDGTSGAFIYGAQLEAGSFATSYIPTVASQVTRNADVATMTGTNFSSWYNASAGTFVADFDTANPAGVAYIYSANAAGVVGNSIYQSVFTSTTDNYVLSGGVQQVRLLAGVIGANAVAKASMAYASANYAVVANGGTPQTQASGTLPVGVDRLHMGYSAGGGNFINGHIRQIAYFNSRLPNAQLQALTAPPLITSLSLDFINGVYEG